MYTSAITTQKYIQCFEMKGGGGGEERERAERKTKKHRGTSVFSLMLIIYVVCAFYYYYLFIYCFLFQQPARFSKASWTGKLYQTFEFSFKRLSPRFIYIFLLLYTCLVVIWRGEHMKL